MDSASVPDVQSRSLRGLSVREHEGQWFMGPNRGIGLNTRTSVRANLAFDAVMHRRPDRGLSNLLILQIVFLCTTILILTSVSFAQQAPTTKPAPLPRPTGVSTGAPYAPVKDALSRPITAGGFIEGAPIVFADATVSSKLSGFQHVSGNAEKKFILEVPGSGVALFDYDRDGWLDVYLVNGSTFAAYAGKEKAPKAALFRNNHDGTFANVTDKAGVGNERWGFGVAVGDIDNDGWPDLYVSNFGQNRLYRNNHDGTFADIAVKAGVTAGGWSTGVTMGDYDSDGNLDIFVAGYVHFDLEHPPESGSSGIALNFCQYRGQPVMCGPRGLQGERDHLFHNNGDGTFTDVSEKAGVADPSGYYGFGAIFVDANSDGKLDLLVANDSTPNFLYINKGDGTFEDASYPSGFALNENGREQAGMGIAVGDYRNDGRLALYVTNFSDDYNTLYKDDGDGNYTDVSFQMGVGEPTIPFLGWGTSFLDYDNDGWKDLLVSNGHVYRSVDKYDWGTTWAQRPLLFHNREGHRFELVPAAPQGGLAAVVAGRGLAVGDLFNDGAMSAVINSIDGQPLLLRNVHKTVNHWVGLKLIGGPKSPRDATGTTVLLTADGIKQRQDVVSGGSYASNSDPRLHFGLGSAARVDDIEIYWPSGAIEHLKLPGVDQIFAIEEGKGLTVEKVSVVDVKKPVSKKAVKK